MVSMAMFALVSRFEHIGVVVQNTLAPVVTISGAVTLLSTYAMILTSFPGQYHMAALWAALSLLITAMGAVSVKHANQYYRVAVLLWMFTSTFGMLFSTGGFTTVLAVLSSLSGIFVGVLLRQKATMLMSAIMLGWTLVFHLQNVIYFSAISH